MKIKQIDNCNILIEDEAGEVKDVFQKAYVFPHLTEDNSILISKKSSPDDIRDGVTLSASEVTNVNDVEFSGGVNDLLKLISAEIRLRGCCGGADSIDTGSDNGFNILNDSIIAFHIDTTSTTVTDQKNLEKVIKDWSIKFSEENPNRKSQIIINPIKDEFTTTFSSITSLKDDNIALINGSDLFSSDSFFVSNNQNIYTYVELWLQSPIQMLLRNAYNEFVINGEDGSKYGDLEGLSFTFFNESSFLDYAEGKNLLVFCFCDESNLAGVDSYHGNRVNFFKDEPTVGYKRDYENFKKLTEKLSYFRGLLHPITDVSKTVSNSFLLHVIASIEAKSLTSQEIDVLLGEDKVNAYGLGNMSSNFYSNLNKNNPYELSGLTMLKELGWTAKLNETTPVSNVFDSYDFTSELEDLLNS